MRQHFQRPNFSPSHTSKAVQWLVWSLLGAGLLITLFSQIFGPVLGAYTPQNLLSLSSWGISQMFLWQFFTFLFVVPAPLGLYFAFYLLVSLYLIWVIGGLLADRVGAGPFLRIFFICGVLAGGCALAVATLWGGAAPLAGSACALYALLVAWTMFDPNMQLLLFMIFPVRAKWLVLGLLGINLLMDLSGQAYIYALANIFGAIFGYLYGVLGWDLRGPFEVTHGFDAWLGRIGRKIRGRYQRSASEFVDSKVYDLKTGRAVVDDEEFIEAMLTKISLHGRGSLTLGERWRLRRASRRSR